MENYNRRIKDILGPFINRRGKTIIPWPLLLVFLKNEEKYFRNRIKYKLTEEPKKIDKIKFITIANEKEDKIQDIIKNNNIPLIRWLGYKSYSCRYDSFLFLFFTTIYKIYESNNNLYKSNNINDLIKLIDVICKELKLNKPTYIWDICNRYKNYSLDILNVNNGYKKEYHIHSLFNWLKGDSLFTITYKLIKSCSLCFKYVEQKVQLYPLISITIDELNSCNNFDDILYNKLKINNSICEDC